jgi:hypothetical protein
MIFSDDWSNARGVSMSKASMISSFGVNAYGINPANYDYREPILLSKDKSKNKLLSKPRWEISVFSTGGSYGSDSSIDFYNNYIKYLSINRETFSGLFSDLNSVFKFRDSVLPGEETEVNYDFEFKWLSVNFSNKKIGAVNFTIADRVGLNTNSYSRDQELPLTFNINIYGNKYDLTNVELNQAEATAWWIRKYSLGYSKQIDFGNKSFIRSLTLGVSGSLVQGFGNVITYPSTLHINTYGVVRNPSTGINHVDSIKGKQDFHSLAALTDFFLDYRDGAEAHFNLFPKPAGTGASLDLGLAIQIGTQWRIGASVTDLGKITWDYNTYIDHDTNSFIYRNFDLTSTDPTYNTFVNDLDGLDTRITNIQYDTDMPTKFRAGISFTPSERFMCEFDWAKGNNDFPGNTVSHVLSFGSEYYPAPYLPVRMGISVGGPGDFYIGIGAGVKFSKFTFDIGTNGINQIFASKRLSISLSTKVIL